ncbi:hypothetical protein JTB14_021886 [Gonioctena quinquepunctata]|nr:hypothetical protein JTB14_021886 [Gonioctena quinquepunctata]
MIEFIFHNSNIELCVYEDTKIVANITLQKEGDILMEPEWERATLKLAQDKDIFCQEVIKLVKEEDAQEASYYLSKDGILYRVENDGDKLIVPKTFIPKVMEDFHDSPMAGHPGQQKTLMSLKRRFFWPNMRTDVMKYCTSCDACNRRKTSPHVKKAPLQRFTPTTEPWELTSMDVVGPLVTSLNGNRYLLTFQDYFTKYVEAIPLPDQKADTIARAFVENVIVRHGSPKRLLTDRGANFTSSLFKEVCKVLGIEKLQTASYAPTTNGQIERMHRVLKDMLSHYISENQRDWDNWIPFVLMAYRGSTHSSTGYSPYFLLHGRDQVLPMDSMISSGRIRYDYDDNYASELLERLRRLYSDVYKNTEKAKSERVKRYNKKTEEHKFNLGDQVYLKDMAVKRGLSKKLVRSWIGPYRIIEMIGPVTCRIRKCGGRDEQIVHVNRLKIYTARTDEEHRSMREERKKKRENKKQYTELESEEEAEEIGRFHPMMVPQYVNVAPDENTSGPSSEEEETDVHSESEEEQLLDEPATQLRRSSRFRRPPDRWAY